jgi:hypothetical protein
MYRKRALTVESGPRGKVRYCRPAAAAKARRAAKVGAAYMRAAEARSATAPEMGRTAANPHPATAEMTAHPMGDAASMKSAASTAMKSATTAAMKSAATAAVKSAATAAASSGACVSGARESSRQDNNAENLDF